MERAGRSAEGRQRWRIVFRRTPLPEAAGQLDAWADALAASGLPVIRRADEPVPMRPSLAAPLPAAFAGEGEMLDVILSERLPVDVVRRRLADSIPDGCTLVDIHDVRLGEPALPGRVVAADYRIVLGGDGPLPDGDEVREAAATLLAADALPRERDRGASRVAYDLRPLLVDVRLADAGPPPAIDCRVRFDPERGVGRPAEVVAALAEVVGVPSLRAASVVRRRLLLEDDPG